MIITNFVDKNMLYNIAISIQDMLTWQWKTMIGSTALRGGGTNLCLSITDILYGMSLGNSLVLKFNFYELKISLVIKIQAVLLENEFIWILSCWIVLCWNFNFVFNLFDCHLIFIVNLCLFYCIKFRCDPVTGLFWGAFAMFRIKS